eukprot:scaffold380443_cov17-Prasinocladus_malaysianus.AAC.1
MGLPYSTSTRTSAARKGFGVLVPYEYPGFGTAPLVYAARVGLMRIRMQAARSCVLGALRVRVLVLLRAYSYEYY